MDDFAPYLIEGYEIELPLNLRGKWNRRSLDTDIEFYLWTKNKNQLWGERKKSRRCPVIPGLKTNSRWEGAEALVCWRELWVRRRENEFELKDASFTFFWGYQEVTPIDTQLFRAEWTQLGHGSKTAAHPHWQVDWPLPDYGDDISGIHFGMAGWECKGATDFPAYWQRFVEKGFEHSQAMGSTNVPIVSLDQIADFFPVSFRRHCRGLALHKGVMLSRRTQQLPNRLYLSVTSVGFTRRMSIAEILDPLGHHVDV